MGKCILQIFMTQASGCLNKNVSLVEGKEGKWFIDCKIQNQKPHFIGSLANKNTCLPCTEP